MFSKLLQTITDHYAKKLPFVVYRKPKEDTVQAILQNSGAVHYVKDFTETGFVFAPFDSNQPSVLLSCDTIHKASYESAKKAGFKKDFPLEIDLSKKEFHVHLVRKGIAEIAKSTLKKVVLSRKVAVNCEIAPLDLFQKLLDNYETAFCYLWHHPEIGTWLGATPEILLKVENRQFTTMSLAGTQKYVDNSTPEWGKKELEEQQLVTDYIAHTLQSSVSNLNIGVRQTVQAGNLLHLRTKLSGRIEKGSLANIITALHPTPAVCGLPLDKAKKFILDNETYDRSYYTGFLGELNFKSEKDRASSSRNQENKAYRSVKNSTTLFVNLRCMQLTDAVANLYIGGGVTQDSDPEKEWQETIAKSKTMSQVLRDD